MCRWGSKWQIWEHFSSINHFFRYKLNSSLPHPCAATVPYEIHEPCPTSSLILPFIKQKTAPDDHYSNTKDTIYFLLM